MKKNFVILSLILTVNFGYSQIKPNELLVYDASYNMSGLMTQLAQVVMQTETTQTSKNTYLHLSWEAATFSKWDTFFKIRDRYESYVDPVSLKPALYKRSVFEGGYSKTEKYIFTPNSTVVQATTSTKNRPEVKNNFSINGSTQDIITMVFKLRTIDFSKFKTGQTIGFTIVFDQKEYPVSIKYMGKEIISAGNLGKKDCYVLSIAAKTDRLKGKDKNLIWLTADTKRIPALVRFSIPVGTGQMSLSRAAGI